MARIGKEQKALNIVIGSAREDLNSDGRFVLNRIITKSFVTAWTVFP
jgi:hypothetical protein